MKVLAVLGIVFCSLLGSIQMSSAKQNPITAIDILLEPDATMVQHAEADNARLLKVFPKGFALDSFQIEAKHCADAIGGDFSSPVRTSNRLRADTQFLSHFLHRQQRGLHSCPFFRRCAERC
jgi:hypothetical protein